MDKDMLMYVICEHFHVLPSQVKQENYIDMLKLVAVMQGKNAAELMLSKKKGRRK